MSDSLKNRVYFKLPSTEDFITKIPLYKTFDINVLNVEEVKEYVNYCGPVDLYCIECNQISVFVSDKPFSPDSGRSGSGRLSTSGIIAPPKEYEPPNFFLIELVCSRNRKHKVFFCFNYLNEKIQKIGQFPSYADFQEENVKKYKKILGDKYLEFAKAIGLVSHGIGIGSFVYLRRIFENLIEEAHLKAKINAGWNDELYNSSRMDEKIKLLKDFLPIFLVEKYSIYSILSKGIHSLSEEECLEYFYAIRIGIELILDEKIESLEKSRKTSEANKSIEEIKTKINKRT